MPITARDGAYDQIGGLSVGVPEVAFPFIKNGDSVAKIIRRRAKQTPSAWLADRAAARFTPGEAFDTEYTDAVLVEQSDPTTTETGLYAIARTFATVPADQVTIGSRVITKPAFTSQNFGGYYITSTASNATADIWGIAQLATVSAYATGGTFTVTYKTSTTGSLNWNDSNATIAAAINALADMVADLTTVSVVNAISTAGTVSITRATGSADFLGNWSWTPSLTPTVVSDATTGSADAILRSARASINYNKTAHGVESGDEVMLQAGTSGSGSEYVATFVDADNFTVANSSPTANFAATPYFRKYVRSYTPGTDRVRIRYTQRFYLPGFTHGIETPEDIPLPTLLMNDTDFLTAIASSAPGFADYDASELIRWNEWPIYTQTFQAIDLDSV